MIDKTLNDVKDSTPEEPSKEILYPDERVLATRKENLEQGIPVEESVWEIISSL